MVISFSDSMQLTFAARDRLIAGETRRGVSQCRADSRAGLRADPRHRRRCRSSRCMFSKSDLIRTFGEAGLVATVIALVAVLIAGAAARRAAGPQRAELRREGRERGCRRQRAAPLLRLDRHADGHPSGPLQPHQPRRGRRPRRHLRQSRAALPACRPGARQASRRSPPAAASTPSSPAPIRSTC